MGKMKIGAITGAGIVFLLMGYLIIFAADTAAPRMSNQKLKSLLGDPAVIAVDVRVEAEWKSTRWKIKGAVREDPEKEINAWASKYSKDKTLVFYCS